MEYLVVEVLPQFSIWPPCLICKNVFLNYFRLVLRCRQDARARFAKMRSDVLVKIELLDQKHGKYVGNRDLLIGPPLLPENFSPWSCQLIGQGICSRSLGIIVSGVLVIASCLGVSVCVLFYRTSKGLYSHHYAKQASNKSDHLIIIIPPPHQKFLFLYVGSL